MESETYHDRGALCPYCGHLNHAGNSDGELYDEMIEQYECAACDRFFMVSANNSWSWTCKPIQEPAQQ